MSTILLVGVFLFADEKIPLSSALKNALYFSTIASSVVTSILYPPSSLTIVVYANAFFSIAFALRAVELLIVNQPCQLKRLQRIHAGSASPPVYIWRPMPPVLSFARLVYVCDLLLNPRGIGWAHGSRKYLPRLEKLNIRPATENENGEHLENPKFILKDPTENRVRFLARETLKLIIAYVVYDTYRTFFGRNYTQFCAGFHFLLNSSKLHHAVIQYLGLEIRTSPETSAKFVHRFLLPPACWAACWAFIDGIRATVALFSVGGLYIVSPSLAADTWMYPDVFGSLRDLFRFRLKGNHTLQRGYQKKTQALTTRIDIWGKLWHDLCRRALISSSTAVVPLQIPLALRRALIGVFSFIISGFVHAAGTYAVNRDTHAVFMMIVFFILLPICIVVQELVSRHVLERYIPNWWIARALFRVLDAAFVLLWGYHTAPWFFRYSMIPESLASIPIPETWSFW